MIAINEDLISKVTEKSKISERKRQNFCFHYGNEDLIQRMINVLQSDSYIRPHKHVFPLKREIFIVLKGRFLYFEFNDSCEIITVFELNQAIGNYGVEIEPGVFHTLVAIENDSVVYEIKDGPYNPVTDKIFASESPNETDDNVAEYLQNLKNFYFNKK